MNSCQKMEKGKKGGKEEGKEGRKEEGRGKE
jgi:hypothetical protein